MKLKLFNVNNIEKLFEVIDSCDGKVELVGEDISLNLKSKLSQYFSMAKLLNDNTNIDELELRTYKDEDTQKLMKFMMEGK